LGELKRRDIRVVSIDLPTSWMMAASGADEFTKRMFGAVNGMHLEVLAATARKDYDDRRRRQAQGIMKAKDAGKFKRVRRERRAQRRHCCDAEEARELERHSGRNQLQPCNHRQDRRPSEGRPVDRPGPATAASAPALPSAARFSAAMFMPYPVKAPSSLLDRHSQAC
jgi:hypothetical protein